MLITAGRASFAVLALFISIRSQGRGLGQGMKNADFRTLLMASIMLAIHWATFFVAVKVGGVAIATLGFASFPAFITLCEWAVLPSASPCRNGSFWPWSPLACCW